MTRHGKRLGKCRDPTCVGIGDIAADAMIHVSNSDGEPEMFRKYVKRYSECDAVGASGACDEYRLLGGNQPAFANRPTSCFDKRIGSLR